MRSVVLWTSPSDRRRICHQEWEWMFNWKYILGFPSILWCLDCHVFPGWNTSSVFFCYFTDFYIICILLYDNRLYDVLPSDIDFIAGGGIEQWMDSTTKCPHEPWTARVVLGGAMLILPPPPLLASGDSMFAWGTIHAGRNAGRRSDGKVSKYVTGRINPLDYYWCLWRLFFHGPDVTHRAQRHSSWKFNGSSSCAHYKFAYWWRVDSIRWRCAQSLDIVHLRAVVDDAAWPYPLASLRLEPN